MKIAIVHDAIFTKAGGERVLLNVHQSFPDATIFTSIFDSKNTYPEFSQANIKTTWLDYIASNEKVYKLLFFPLGILASRSINLSGYDVVFATTTHSAKYIKVDKDCLVINYCFTPFRLAWNPESYNLYKNSQGVKRKFLDFIILILKKIDFKYAQRANHYIAMTEETSKRIKDCYSFNYKIDIINPSIDTSKYYISNQKKEYYLVVSRLEEYKKVDLAINTFNKLGFNLKIVGGGMESSYLKNMAKSNIEFLEKINDNELADLYSNCKALIFPQHEDYGLTPIEANASGRPVIALNKGGVLETGIPYSGDDQSFTMVLFREQTVDSLINAINLFEKLDCNPEFIRSHSLNFDDKVFINRIREYVYKKLELKNV
mgnify:CR=1 FL=1